MKNLHYYATLVIILSTTFFSCASVRHDRKNPEMIEVPKGWFKMGMNASNLNEAPEHDVYVDSFLIDEYEVSARDFADFLNKTGNPDERYFSSDKFSTIVMASSEGVHNGQATKFSARQGFGDFPANNISWYGAEAYCRSKGKRLPTEAEWEKAARGQDRRKYPWGDALPDELTARYGQNWVDKGFNVMVPVNSLAGGSSYYGAFNMAGNVWEWVNDWYRQYYVSSCAPAENARDLVSELSGKKEIIDTAAQGQDLATPEQQNPKGPSVGIFKVLRGGSWYDSNGEMVIRSTYRFWLSPDDRFINTGFRCAK